MSKIKSLAIIFSVWALGEIISLLIKGIAAIPGSIIGMILLFILLWAKMIKLPAIEETADFLLQHITLFILPFGIAFVKYWEIIKGNFLVIILVGVVSTIVSLVLTMKFVDLLMSLSKKRKKDAD